MRNSQLLFVLLVVALGFACGDEEADLCYSPAGIPSYVGRTGTTSPHLGNFSGCGAALPTTPTDPSDIPDGALCSDACIELAGCGNADFDTCIESCEANPGCADAFRCFRDTSCANQIDECLDELSACQ